MVKTPKCLASFSSSKMVNPSFTALWPHAEKPHSAGCRLRKPSGSVLFFFLTCLVWVSEVLLSPGCRRVDPNTLGGNLPEIRLNVGWIILSDLLIWQFALTNRLQHGPCTYLNDVFLNAWWAARCAQLVGWSEILLNSRHNAEGVSVCPSTVCKKALNPWRAEYTQSSANCCVVLLFVNSGDTSSGCGTRSEDADRNQVLLVEHSEVKVVI